MAEAGSYRHPEDEGLCIAVHDSTIAQILLEAPCDYYVAAPLDNFETVLMLGRHGFPDQIFAFAEKLPDGSFIQEDFTRLFDGVTEADGIKIVHKSEKDAALAFIMQLAGKEEMSGHERMAILRFLDGTPELASRRCRENIVSWLTEARIAKPDDARLSKKPQE